MLQTFVVMVKAILNEQRESRKVAGQKFRPSLKPACSTKIAQGMGVLCCIYLRGTVPINLCNMKTE